MEDGKENGRLVAFRWKFQISDCKFRRERIKQAERTANEIVVENRAHRKREHASMEIARSRHAIVKHETELASCYFRASQRLPGNSLAITEVLEA